MPLCGGCCSPRSTPTLVYTPRWHVQLTGAGPGHTGGDYITHLDQDQNIIPQKGFVEVVREMDVLASLFSLLPV